MCYVVPMLRSLRSLGEVSGVKVSRSAPLRQPRRSAVCSMEPQNSARESVDGKTLAPAHEENTRQYYAPDALGSHREGPENERSLPESCCLQLGKSHCCKSANVVRAGDCVQVILAATIRAVAFVSLQYARAFDVNVGFVLCALPTRNAGQMGPNLGAAHKWMEHRHRGLCFGRTCEESKWAWRSDKGLVHCPVSRYLCFNMRSET